MESGRTNRIGNENLEIKELMKNVSVELERLEFKVREKFKDNLMT